MLCFVKSHCQPTKIHCISCKSLWLFLWRQKNNRSSFPSMPQMHCEEETPHKHYCHLAQTCTSSLHLELWEGIRWSWEQPKWWSSTDGTLKVAMLEVRQTSTWNTASMLLSVTEHELGKHQCWEAKVTGYKVWDYTSTKKHISWRYFQ